MNQYDKTLVLGASGLVGRAVKRALWEAGHRNILAPTHKELDLCSTSKTVGYFEAFKPDYVIIASGRVGGIFANNTYPADFIHDNAMIAANSIRAAWLSGAKKTIYLGSSCIYPRDCPQPIKEEYLLTGPLEETNRAYATAKIAGIEMAQAYHRQFGCNIISLMPTNLYGPGDTYHQDNSHVIPSLILKFHEAKAYRLNSAGKVTCWGTGLPLREFLYVEDLADAILWAIENYDSPEILNVGSGEEVRIRDLAEMIAHTVGYDGNVLFDGRKEMDGTPRKVLDCSKINNLGWSAKTKLKDGLEKTYNDFLTNSGRYSSVHSERS